MWGIWLTWWQIYYVIGDGQWYLFSNRMLQLVRTQITFGSIVHFLSWILSKSACFLLEAIFEFWTLSLTIKSVIFKPNVILVYRLNNVSYITWQLYTGMYRYIDSPLVLTGHCQLGTVFAGYCFLLFQDEMSVQTLIEHCIVDDEKLYWCVSSPTMKDKPVSVLILTYTTRLLVKQTV